MCCSRSFICECGKDVWVLKELRINITNGEFIHSFMYLFFCVCVLVLLPRHRDRSVRQSCQHASECTKSEDCSYCISVRAIALFLERQKRFCLRTPTDICFNQGPLQTICLCYHYSVLFTSSVAILRSTAPFCEIQPASRRSRNRQRRSRNRHFSQDRPAQCRAA